MRIAMVTYNWLSTIGGVSHYVECLRENILQKTAFQVSIVAPDILAERDGGRTVEGDRFALSASTFRALQALKPDIVHCHDNAWMGIGCLAYRLLHPFSCRAIFSAHTMQYAGDVPKRIGGKFELVQDLIMLTRDLLLRSWDRVTAVSSAMGAQLRNCKVDIVPFGVSCTEPSESEVTATLQSLGIGSHNTIIASIGVFYHEWKVIGLEVLIAAFAGLGPRFSGARLVIVGDGQLRARLQEFVAAKGVADKVIFAGYMRDPGPILSACDVCAHLATNEALGFAVAEAMWFGKPVVGANCGGIPELVKHRESGFLVAPVSNEANAAIAWLLEHPLESKKMGEEGRRIVHRRYTWEKITSQFETMYVDLAGEMGKLVPREPS